MTETVVQVEGLGKRYRLGVTHADSLSEMASACLRRFRNLRHRGEPSDRGAAAHRLDFWALRDVGFGVRRGEVLGVIGRNGAGKSTLLKLISRVTSPTTGRIDLQGRVASLLEVGTGFHPDLTGRENVFMNATLLGMTRREVRHRFDEIVEFAGVSDFLETPVKRYSSGMRVRLGFSVAAHLEAEILVVDEVLTVGDAEFQAKCLGKMQTVATSGRTVLFVSHNMGAVRKLCGRAILLEKGELTASGSSDDVVNRYLSLRGPQERSLRIWSREETIDLAGKPQLSPIRFASRHGDGTASGTFSTDDPIDLTFDFCAILPVSGVRIGVIVRNDENVTLFGSNMTLHASTDTPRQSHWRVSCTIPANLLNQGGYRVDFGIDRPPESIGDFLEQECIQFHVSDLRGHGVASEALPGVVRPPLQWKFRPGAHP